MKRTCANGRKATEQKKPETFGGACETEAPGFGQNRNSLWTSALAQMTAERPRSRDETRRAYLTQKNREWRARQRAKTHNAKVSGAGTASAGLPGYAGDNEERKS